MNALRAGLPINHCYRVRRWPKPFRSRTTRRAVTASPPGEPNVPNSEPAVPHAPGKDCYVALTTSLDRVQRAVAMNRQLAEAEATLARLIDSLTKHDRADHETTSA